MFFCFNCLFRFLKSLRKHTWFYLGLGCAKDGASHSESFATSRTHSRNKRSTTFLNISSCTFGTGYARKHIGFASYFNSKSTGSIFQVPSVSLNNYSNFCNHFSNSLHCVIVRFLHWVSITLCKSACSYLASNITRNCLVSVRTCYDSYTYST